MVDIDEMVMDACQQFMPGVCGDYLRRENWEGPRHRIIAGCAIEFLKDAIVILQPSFSRISSKISKKLLLHFSQMLLQKSGKKYDYVFGDLTDTPVSTTAERDQDLWEFLRSIISMGVRVLKPDGIQTHAGKLFCN